MNTDIHPKYYPDATVTCNCGATFTVGSTEPEIRVEVCSACHPFYTGKANLIDTAGRVDKFKERRKKSEELASKKKSVTVASDAEKSAEKTNTEKLKELKKQVS